MSDTPRTDEAQTEYEDPFSLHGGDIKTVWHRMRGMERELSKSRKEAGLQTYKRVGILRERDMLRELLTAASKDAEKFREYKQVRKAALMENTLRMDFTINHAGQVFGNSAVVSAEEFSMSVLGIKAIGLRAEELVEKLFSAIAVEGKSK